MKPRLGPFVRSMRPSQRRALGSLMAVLVLSLLYSGSYAVLRLNGYFTRGASTDFGYSMFARTSSRVAFYHDGQVTTWGTRRNPTPLRTLRFFGPMVRIEGAVRNVISRLR